MTEATARCRAATTSLWTAQPRAPRVIGRVLEEWFTRPASVSRT